MTTTTKTCAVTIAGPDRRVDLVVSTETPVSELIPTFVEMSSEDPPNPDAAQPVWSVAPPGQQPLPLDRTLREAGIADGDVLTLTEVRSQEQAPPRPAELRKPRAKHGPLSERMQTLLPTRLDSLGRVSVATRAFFGYEEESAVIESAPPPVESAQARLSRPEQRGPLARARFAWRESDYLGRLDRRIAEPRLTRCVTVAVVSPKGGVGKTTTTALLGSLLAGVRRDRIVAVDTNPDYGSLGRALTPDHSVYVDDLIDVLDRPDLSATALDGHLGRASDGLMVLPAPTHPARMAALDEAAYTNVIQQLKSLVGVLVLDCGTGLQEPAARAAQAAADQIVLISDAHPSTASLVAEAAARTYFQSFHPGCDVKGDQTCASDLAPQDAALLAGMVSSPSAYNPIAHPQAATDRRNVVLQRMYEQEGPQRASRGMADAEDVAYLEAIRAARS